MEHGPIWIVEYHAPPYPDERFDGVATIPPLNPQQPTPEQIADAAREALPDMLDVLRNWGYIQTYPLTWMKKLVALLRPPAYYEQAKEDEP